MRKRDRGHAHFYRRIRRENEKKMSDGEDQNEQPAAAMAMPGVNYYENAGIVQPTYVRPDLNIGSFIPPLDAEEAAVAWERWFKTFVRKTRFFQSGNVAGQTRRVVNIRGGGGSRDFDRNTT